MIDGARWFAVKDTDPRAIALYRRHYSARPRGKDFHRAGIGGPGETMTLLTLRADALFVWRERKDSDQQYDDGQRGIMCAVFRNESDQLSSDLIREAEELARMRWGARRLFTYVDARKIRSNNPGACFKRAGWKRCGMTAGGLHILEGGA